MNIPELKDVNNVDTFVFSMDIDWASDVVIEKAVNYFKDCDIPITVFCTHQSEYIQSLINMQGISYGIHPNFIFPSSQGGTRMEVIDYCCKAFPKVKAFRAHRWYADNDIYEELYKRGIRYESNLCTLMSLIPPYVHRSGMLSFPTFFEDGAYLYHKMDLSFSNIKSYFLQSGIKVINVHPMHLVLNTPYFSYMREIKDTLTRDEWNGFDFCDIYKYENTKRIGIRDFVSEIIEFAKKKQYPLYTLDELYNNAKGR